jgi:hypothetical protein
MVTLGWVASLLALAAPMGILFALLAAIAWLTFLALFDHVVKTVCASINALRGQVGAAARERSFAAQAKKVRPTAPV